MAVSSRKVNSRSSSNSQTSLTETFLPPCQRPSFCPAPRSGVLPPPPGPAPHPQSHTGHRAASRWGCCPSELLLASVIISLWKCILNSLSQLLNVIFLPGGREAAWGESAELWAHEWAFDQGSPRADRFSHKPEGLHFPSEAPLAQDPQSIPEPQGDWEVRGLPAEAQSTWKACRLSWPLPFLSQTSAGSQGAFRNAGSWPRLRILMRGSWEGPGGLYLS